MADSSTRRLVEFLGDINPSQVLGIILRGGDGSPTTKNKERRGCARR